MMSGGDDHVHIFFVLDPTLKFNYYSDYEVLQISIESSKLIIIYTQYMFHTKTQKKKDN